MKIFVKYLVSFFCLLTTLDIQAGPNSADENTIVNEMIPAWMDKNSIPGVAVEIYTNGVPHSYNFGFADSHNKTPISDKTIFELGSITKIFTSLLVAEAINAGKMQLNAPISKYVPDLFPAGTKITVLNLETHTASLPLEAPAEIDSRVKLAGYFSHWTPPYAIGSQWAYSNVGIGLLGFSLETANHQSLDQMYRANILGPLHMQEIGLRIPKALNAFLSEGFMKDGKVMPPRTQTSLFPAAWAMKACGHDMLLFLKAALGLPGTPEKINKAMRMTETPYVSIPGARQGLVWDIETISWENIATLLNPPAEMKLGPIPAQMLNKNEQKFDEKALIEKTGTTNGFRVYIGIIPNRKSGIVILANRNVPNGEIVKTARTILFKLNNL